MKTADRHDRTRLPTPASERIPANERLRMSFRPWLWSSMIAATVVHFSIFALWPSLTAETMGIDTRELEVIPAPDVEIPDAPDPLTRPAEPVVASVEVDEDLTIAPTTLAANPPDELAPPPTAGASTRGSSERITGPFTVAPRIRNLDEVVRAMERAYPRTLRDAGLGGTVHVLFSIDEDGAVRAFEIDRSSGYPALDDAALSVAEVYRFSPALNGDQRVPVWVSFPITFQVRR
jgi:protein TonB